MTFQTTTSVSSNNISMKYQRFTTLGSKDIGIRKSEFVAKTKFLCLNFENPWMFFYEIREQKSITNKFSKSTNFFHEICELFFVFVLKCTEREHVYNLNRRSELSTLKT